MRTIFWIAITFLILGILGIFTNVFTGLYLSKNLAIESDFHLTVALVSVALLIVASLGLLRSSKKNLSRIQELILTKSEKQAADNLVVLTNVETRLFHIRFFLLYAASSI